MTNNTTSILIECYWIIILALFILFINSTNSKLADNQMTIDRIFILHREYQGLYNKYSK